MLAAFSGPQHCLSKVAFIRKASSKLRRQLLVHDRSHWTSWLYRYNSSMADKGTGNEAAGVDPPPEQKSEKKLKKEAKKEAKLAKYKDKVKQQQAQPTAQSEVIVPLSPSFFPPHLLPSPPSSLPTFFPPHLLPSPPSSLPTFFPPHLLPSLA